MSTDLFTDSLTFRAIKQRIEDGIEWRKTPFYRDTLARIKVGQTWWGCSSEADLDCRFEYLDRLIQSIRENGYRQSFEITIGNEVKSRHPIASDEVMVNIGRDGQYLFQNGRHRLSIALVLGIKKIPVKALVRHSQWQAFRQKIVEMAREGTGKREKRTLYQACLHPDLADIPAAHGCKNAGRQFADHLPPAPGRALDIGANLGYFCHRLEDKGFDCVAVEHLPNVARACDMLRIAEEKRFRTICGDIFNPAVSASLLSNHYKVVLALNIFHHFIKTRASHERLVRLLAGLKAETVFFEPHRIEETQM